jgi:hypothetical protein
MGWSGGSELAGKIWDAVKAYLPEDKKGEIAFTIVDAFEDEDCDTMQETDDLHEYAYPWTVEEVDADDELCENAFYRTEAEADEGMTTWRTLREGRKLVKRNRLERTRGD